MEDGKNYEYVLKVGGSIIKPDFFVKRRGLIIEFDGVYWHSRNTNKKRDAKRDKLIIDEGYMWGSILKILADKGVDAALLNFHTLKPFDDALAIEYAQKCKKVFTVEEHSVIGGLGDAVASAIIGHGVEKFDKIGINDVFGQSGKPADLLVEYGLTGKQIADRISNNL